MCNITPDRAHALHKYIRQELNVAEVTPEGMVRRLSANFLKKQTHQWVQNLYEFLDDQYALRGILPGLPLVRLENGEHVSARNNIFLPGKMETNFPTVHAEVCQTQKAREFLQRALGLSEPNLVDDIILNVLPKYGKQPVTVGDEYGDDIARILKTANDSGITRRNSDRLTAALSTTAFVKSANAAGGEKQWLTPGEVYLATERLSRLFAKVSSVMLVDNSCDCLRGDDIAKLLKVCGAAACLKPVERNVYYSGDEARKWREQSGYPHTSGRNDHITDWDIVGLDALLRSMPVLSGEESKACAKLLWDELAYLSEQKGEWFFTATYRWTHHGNRYAKREAAFVRLLQNSNWVPDENGELSRPDCVLFDSLGWEKHPFLQSVIPFKLAVVDELAKKAGIEPGVIDLLKMHGITEEGLRKLIGKKPKDTPEPGIEGDAASGKSTTHTPKQDGKTVSEPGTPGISVEPTTEGTTTKPELGERAVNFVCEKHPQWKKPRTKTNPGYDLYQPGDNGEAIAWCEVKGLSGDWDKQPVSVTSTQFEFAYKKQSAFWLYVVEYAGTDAARITRIQNPAGRDGRFLFGSGWRNEGVD